VSTPLKLAGFAALLVLVFAVASVAGGAIGPDRQGAAEKRAQTPAMKSMGKGDEHVAVPDGGEAAGHNDAAGGRGGDAGHGGEADAIRGLSVSDNGLELALARTQLPRGRSAELRFAVRDGRGRAVGDFEVTHSKRMHLIVVRRDGRGFQHLHPRLDGGTWRTRITLPQAGSYRVFADFKRGGRAYTLATDVAVDGSANYRPLPKRTTIARTDGYRVKLDATGSELRFDITRDGRKIETEPYLGAGGHLVALREGDLAFLHVHPNGEGVAFEADLARTSRYRLYLQFKHDGRVHTAEFTR
jgi:hypothetical protein